jgi:hypothetical protein
MMGAWSDATDGYDESYDFRLPDGFAWGYAGVYHEDHVNGWNGPTGFYKNDMRAPLAPNETKTWDSIYVWSDPNFADPEMALAMVGNVTAPPPGGWTYRLTLLAVPKGITGAPAVGTTWAVSPEDELLVMLPTYTTTNGLTAYRFAFSVTASPEPAALALGLLLATVGRRR